MKIRVVTSVQKGHNSGRPRLTKRILVKKVAVIM